MAKSYLFYDLETSGLNVAEDRIMQFGAQRTDMDLNPIGEPINLLVKTTDDTLPSIGAIKTTGITPQSTQADGLTEAEFCKYVIEEVFTPDTIIVGFNNIRYDNQMMRYTLWRNFYDPYEWEWKDGRNKWDILDVVRLTRALRPEGIEWPVDEDNMPVNRLELITKLNHINHEHAHDALSDVFATIAVAKLIKEKQPKIYDWLLNHHDKDSISRIVNLADPKPFVYASGSYGKKNNFVTVAVPLTVAENDKIMVYDLRYNLDEVLTDQAAEQEFVFGPIPSPIVKKFDYKKCPAVAPISVLDADDGWKKVGLKKEQVEANLRSLFSHPEIAEQVRLALEKEREWPENFDPESSLYSGFLNDKDRYKCSQVRAADANKLADLHPMFDDERLPDLLIHYKAKNFPNSLTENESIKWEEYRLARLKRQAPAFVADLQKASAEGVDDFLIEELTLWYQSLLPSEY
ncbi:exodeoxyribonuclease I [Candidatus Saccharibacteria bacterium]|nr:exodeoxyribonuclease I [Candidatus Saccharibacteria bacterium]